MNSIPAVSNASRSFSIVRVVVWGTPADASSFTSVRLETLARSESSAALQPNRPRAARICPDVST
jgi:hypothetical protein